LGIFIIRIRVLKIWVWLAVLIAGRDIIKIIDILMRIKNLGVIFIVLHFVFPSIKLKKLSVFVIIFFVKKSLQKHLLK